MKLELDLQEIKIIVSVLVKSDPMGIYVKALVDKIQQQAESQLKEEKA
jgi:hypothetical protein